jgi:hypothetical protein
VVRCHASLFFRPLSLILLPASPALISQRQYLRQHLRRLQSIDQSNPSINSPARPAPFHPAQATVIACGGILSRDSASTAPVPTNKPLAGIHQRSLYHKHLPACCCWSARGRVVSSFPFTLLPCLHSPFDLLSWPRGNHSIHLHNIRNTTQHTQNTQHTQHTQHKQQSKDGRRRRHRCCCQPSTATTFFRASTPMGSFATHRPDRFIKPLRFRRTTQRCNHQCATTWQQPALRPRSHSPELWTSFADKELGVGHVRRARVARHQLERIS